MNETGPASHSEIATIILRFRLPTPLSAANAVRRTAAQLAPPGFPRGEGDYALARVIRAEI
jgi:hypothetical protein